MRLISLRLLALCVILPPALYILSLQGVEAYARRSYDPGIQTVLVGDVQPLLDGRVHLENQVTANIRRFLRELRLPRWGLQLRISVTTKNGQMIYPSPVPTDPLAMMPEDPAATAAENYRLLQEGLQVDLDLSLPHDSLLANLLLVVYLGAALLVMGIHYRLAQGQASREEARTTDFLERMERLSRRHRRLLESLIAEKARLAQDLGRVRSELETRRESADRNEEAMIDEIVALEQKIAENVDQQLRQQEEIKALKEKLAAFEAESARGARAKKRPRQETAKRFSALYKETRFHQRAIEGFDDLPDDLKLRCEEAIHQLDRDPEQVSVKRKVFSKSHETFFEVVFAYRGRIYFRKTAGRGVEIVAVGTKNSQDRDLTFLDSL